MRSTVRLVPACLAGFLLLSGCSGTAPASAPASKPAASGLASASAKPAASASAAAKPAAPASAPASTTAAAGGPIRIGYITDLTGTTAQFGRDGVDGTNLYFESVNNTVAGRKVEVVAVDDEIKPDVGVTKAKQLVESNKVSMIIGVLNTAICYALASYARDAQVPLIITQGCASQFYASDPRFASTYVSRLSLVPMALADPMAEWAYQQGLRKAGFMTFDQIGGLEAADLFAAAFIKRGGTIVQELHPPFPNNPDFGPYLAQLDPATDVLFSFEPGIDGLRFAQQLQNYGGQKKPKVLDFAGVVTDPSNLGQLKDAAVGMVAGQTVDFNSTAPDYQKMVQAWKAKYGDRPLSVNVVNAYGTAQAIAGTIQKVNGNVEDKKAFLDALYAIDTQTVKGPQKLDSTHEPVQNTYIYETVKQQDGGVGFKTLETHPLVPPGGSFTAAQLQKLKPGQNKGKWPGFTKTQLDQLLSGP